MNKVFGVFVKNYKGKVKLIQTFVDEDDAFNYMHMIQSEASATMPDRYRRRHAKKLEKEEFYVEEVPL